jgi:surface protein
MSELKNALINIAEEVRTKIIPENIKAGVQIFDTEGAFLGDTLDTSDATATADDILKDKTAYVNGEKVTGTLEMNAGEYNVQCGYVYQGFGSAESGIQLSITEINGLKFVNTAATCAFSNCQRLHTVKNLDTSNIVFMNGMFDGCKALKNLPILDTSKVTNMNGMFGNDCTALTNESLNNVLAMCINSKSATKTLKYIGLTSAQASTCTGLSNYQAFVNAGWTTGY